jgi:CNT family concentrative nucleoside transporter
MERFWVMDTSGSESLCAAANVFVGMTTAPLVIRPYLSSMTRSELMAMMTGGMATSAGGTMAAYAVMGADPGHLMFANFGSIAVMIGGVSVLAPGRREDFARLGFRSMIGGSLAAFMTASIAGMLIGE